MPDLSPQIDEMKARWMTGSTAEPVCPDAWQSALGEAPNLTLLAMAGQYTRLTTAPRNDTLLARSPLPRLAMPPLSDALRPMFRRVYSEKTVGPRSLLVFLAARGVTAHPSDWMPNASSEVPAVYAPWIDWISADKDQMQDEALTAENWDGWMPQGRAQAFAELRRRAPETARRLLAEKAADVPAEHRLRLVSELDTGLNQADTDLLEALANSRSGKVQALARNLLARLGKFRVDAEHVAEFAEFFEQQKAGMLSRKQIVAARRLKTNAQRKRRFDLAKAMPLSAFAEALGLTPDALIEAYDIDQAPEDLVAMTAATGTEAQAATLLARLAENAAEVDISDLLSRLKNTDRSDLARTRLKHEKTSYQAIVDISGSSLGCLEFEVLSASPAFASLEKKLQKNADSASHLISQALSNLGLLATEKAAAVLLDHFTTKSGLMAADPRLTMLRLNAALKEIP